MTKCFSSSNFKSLHGLLYPSARTWHICKRLTLEWFMLAVPYIFSRADFSEARNSPVSSRAHPFSSTLMAVIFVGIPPRDARPSYLYFLIFRSSVLHLHSFCFVRFSPLTSNLSARMRVNSLSNTSKIVASRSGMLTYGSESFIECVTRNVHRITNPRLYIFSYFSDCSTEFS